VSRSESQRSVAAFLTAVLLLTLGGAAVAQLAHSRAVQRTGDKTTLALLEGSARELQAIEEQARVGQRVEPGMLGASRRLRLQARRSIARLRLVGLDRTFRTYTAALQAEFAAIRRGDLERAVSIDDRRTDPTAETLNAQLAAAHARLDDSAAHASLLATLVTWLAALATAAGTSLLAWMALRAYGRTARAETDRRVVEAKYAQARELEQAKDEFVATVSHELRTPLTSIIGYLELLALESDELTPDHREFVDVIDRNASRLLALVNDLLMVAQAEAGRFELAAAPFSAVQLVDEAVASALPAAESRGVALKASAQAMPDLVGDRARLAQVLDNLIANAVKFTPAGGSIAVRARRAGETLEIEVADTGVGIPADELEHLFDRFYRAASAQRSAVQGSGLGLSIVRLIAEAHGGTVDVVSRVGAGTRFTVVLPLPAAARVGHAA
jgi:signal transduction histidine kinase